MRLVIDANILMSMLISGSKRSAILDKVELFAPEFLLGEIWEHEGEIQQKSKLPIEDVRLALEILASKIHFIPWVEFVLFIPKAEDACPDPDDIEYFAVALAFGCPLWSNDKIHRIFHQSRTGGEKCHQSRGKFWESKGKRPSEASMLPVCDWWCRFPF